MNYDTEIKVSIICYTYNHIKFVRDTLDGFLMQKTTFPYQIIIHDDESTDGTIEVLQEYEKKYKDRLTVIYEEKNQCGKDPMAVHKYLHSLVVGKYTALCEGDDCWTYEYKLQKQYELMEEKPNISMCIHNAKWLCWDTGRV